MAGSEAPVEDISRGELREATLNAVRWVSIARGAAEVLAFASGVVLAHLITPAQFGRLAVAVIVSEMAEAITAEGLGNALVQRRTIDRSHLQAGMLIGLVVGLGLMLATLFLAPLLTTPLFGSETTSLFQLFAPVFLLSGIKIVPLSLLQRRLDFRTSSVIELSGVALSAVTAVALAAAFDLQAKAYVLGAIASALLTLILLLAATRPPLPRLRVREIRELLSFGLPAAFAGLSWVIQRNIDYMILGVRLSAAQVGFYYRAFTVSVEGERRVSGIITRLALPVYSRTQDLEHMRSLRARIVRANATVTFPLLALFIVIAPELMPWLFGAHWQPAVLPAQIMAGAGMAITVNSANSPLLLAANRPRALSVFNLCQLVGYAGTILYCSSYGLISVCIGVVVFQVLVTLAYAVLLNRLVDMPGAQLVHDLGAASVGSVVLVALAVPLSSLLAGEQIPMLIRFVLVGAAAAVAYLAVIRLAFPTAWSDLRLIAERVLRRKGGPPESTTPAQPLCAAEDRGVTTSIVGATVTGETGVSEDVTRESRMPEPTISVAMPAYNAARWIATTVESVLAQTRPPLEIIVVDDGSTDGTAEKLARFGEQVRVISQENRGPSAAYNRAFAAARGDYIAMCPADDVWEPRKLEWQTQSLLDHPEIDIAFGHAREFGLSDAEYDRPPGSGILDNRLFARAMFEVCLIPAPTTLIRRELYERLGPFREDLACEDYEFWMRALAADSVFHYEPRLLVNFRRHGENVSSRLLDMREMAYQVHRLYAKEIPDRAFARSVLAEDLRQIGRYYMDEGRLDHARAAYRRSLRYGASGKAAVGALTLSIPGLGGAVRRIDDLLRPA
jgi:O-antigen/teichoic acid export membrane protein/glycosyltransferase involved in cell wall biosynthesis